MKFPFLIVLGGLLSASAFAQPSTTMRPALLDALVAEVSFSAKEDVTHGNQRLGSVMVEHYGISLSGRRPFANGLLLTGLAFATHQLDADGALPLPDQLVEFSLNAGWQKRYSARWSGGVFVRPGLYGDFENIDGDSFNLPLLILAHYTPRENLTWSFGLNANPFSERPVLPALGVRWQFAPGWTFQLGYPRSGFAWRASETLTWRAGVQFQGGSFRITENLGVPRPGVARLANTFVDYREVRVGLGVDHLLGEDLTLSADVGAMTDRKFDYFDRGYRLDSDMGLFASIRLSAGF